ncbi:MAG: hypothetical protein ABJF04_16160 [Reichenbachiella sp.]|uniref:hypothetical protein n=1 Tax=Reichenbachiella sp. TaxID=2184521 RepID=UPI0032640791
MTKRNISYSSGHPWYYVLGGRVLSIKEIWLDVRSSGCKGYREEEIAKSLGNDAKLRSIKENVLTTLNKDINRYRQYAFELHQYRKQASKNEPICDDVHVSISLKRNHIYNDLAHLDYIDKLTPQLSLF